jgi:hypothetical protein
MISPLKVVYPLDVGAELGLRASTAGGIDGQRQLQQRVPTVLEPVVRQRFYSRQRLQNLGKRSCVSNIVGLMANGSSSSGFCLYLNL